MRSLILLSAIAVLVSARPETYKENEEFQYSRSSSDEGTKQGFYGAQRGNMGGNYEKAHNMDGLAQTQFSSAVNQVHSQLGDSASLPTGSVFTSANTQGIYNQGYKAADLHGKNFQEGTNYLDSQSSLSHLNTGYGAQSHSSLQNEGHGSYATYNTKKSGYSGYRTTGDNYLLNRNNQEALSQISGANQNTYGRQVSPGVNYNQAGYAGYDQSQTSRQSSESRYGTNSQTRYTSAIPVRVVIRPGSTVNVPVVAEAYDNTHSASAFDQNSIKSEAEVLSNAGNQQIDFKPKSYESSYSYHKNWEKHDTVPAVAVPLAIPTINPLPANSELLEDSQGRTGYHGSSAIAQNEQYASGYNSGHHSTSSSQYASGFNTQQQQQQQRQHQTKTAGFRSNAHNSAYNNLGSNAELVGLSTGIVDGVPKKYESSYSYHKSWERQGDPYVIQPVPVDAQTSQRLRSASSNQAGYRSSRYSTQSGYAQSGVNADCDCDENGQVRVTRSAPHYGQQIDYSQQTQNNWDSEDLTQQSQRSGKLEDFGQQTQNKWDSEDLTQQTQQSGNLEDFGQQTQNKWDSEDLTQQTQQSGKLEDFGQQTQNKWGSEDLVQQNQQTHFGNSQNFNQQRRDNFYVGDLTHRQHGRQGHRWEAEDQRAQHGKLGGLDQQTYNQWDNLSQQTQNDRLTGLFQHTQSKEEDFGQQTQGQLDKLDQTQEQSQTNFQQSQNEWKFINQFKPDDVKPVWENPEESHQFPVSSQNDKRRNENSNSNAGTNNSLRGLWGKIDNLEQQTHTENNQGGNNWGQSSYNSHNSWEQSNKESTQSSYNHVGANTHYFGHDSTQRNPANTNILNTGTNTFTNNPVYVKPKDSGRGDIGAEDKTVQVTPEANQIYESDNSKPLKTLEEIQALSLTKETKDKANADINRESHSDDQLSVIGINNERTNLHQASAATTINERTLNHRQLNQNVDFTSKRSVVPSQSFGYDNSEQKSQTTWDQGQDDLGQQVQTNWNLNENLEQQSDLTQQTHNLDTQSDLTQQTQNFNSNGHFQGQGDDFYEQKYHTQNFGQHSARSSQNMEIYTTAKPDVEVFSATVTEVTTPKPGFWKSVGNKFVGAKDTVATWFKSSK